jgi:hypothetical protein
MFCFQLDGPNYSEVSCDTPDAFVAVTRVELAQLSPFYLSIESAVEIGGAILMVMAVAFLLRLVRKSLESKDEE